MSKDYEQSLCKGKGTIIANLYTEGRNIRWYQNAMDGMVLDPSTSLVNGVAYYATQTINNCESRRV